MASNDKLLTMADGHSERYEYFNIGLIEARDHAGKENAEPFVFRKELKFQVPSHGSDYNM